MKSIIKSQMEKLIWFSVKKIKAMPPSPVQLVWDRAVEDSADFMEGHLGGSLLFKEREQIWDYALGRAGFDGLHIECGVFQGVSVNYFAHRRPELCFYGFDSFEGLGEDWSGHHKKKGSFSLDGKIPAVRGNVTLVKGWVDDTFPPFLADMGRKISFLHIDTDTYTPALVVLKAARPYLTPGSIILFDELLGYPNWRNGEFRALGEVFSEDEYRYIGFCNTQAAIEIVRLRDETVG